MPAAARDLSAAYESWRDVPFLDGHVRSVVLLFRNAWFPGRSAPSELAADDVPDVCLRVDNGNTERHLQRLFSRHSASGGGGFPNPFLFDTHHLRFGDLSAASAGQCFAMEPAG